MLLHHRVSPPPRAIPLVLLSGGLLLRLWLAVGQAVGQAQVTTAITPDGTLGTAVTQSGNAYSISGGTRPGNGPNLFHSFDRFSVGTGDIASFTGPQTGITNILSRVTGGQRSDIDGQLRSEIPGANLYLLNPAGVLFGPNASLDVSGSFHVSTADYLRLADGARFSAHLSDTSVLTVAPPAAFGFLGANPAAITIQGSSLRVADGKTLSVVGGDMTIEGPGSLMEERPTLWAPSGRIQMASVASPGEVLLSPSELAPDLRVDSFGRLGWIQLLRGALLDVSEREMSMVSAGGGTVLIRGGRLLMEKSFIYANTRNTDGARMGIDLQLAEDVVVNSGQITAFTLGAGHAGDLRIRAGSVEASNRAFIGPGALETSTSTGQAGDIELTVRQLTLTGGAQISGITFGPGRGGTVRITADSVSIAGVSQADLDGSFLPSGILAGSQPLQSGADAGPAGDVELRVGQLTLTGGANISGSTFGPGRGGTVRITADSVSISGVSPQAVPEGFFLPSGIFANAIGTDPDAGPAGDIAVTVGRLTLTGGAQIATTTFGPGRGGIVTVTATDSVFISGISPQARPDGRVFSSGLFSASRGSGQGGDIRVQARSVALSDRGSIVANSTGTGNAGTIRLQVQEQFRSANSTVTTAATQAGGGDITIEAGVVSLTKDSRITAAAMGASGMGSNGGNVTIQAEAIALNHSQVKADAFGGQGGHIDIKSGVLLIDAGTCPARSCLDASSGVGLPPGTVEVRAPETEVRGAVAPLPQTFASAATLLRNRCAARLHEGTVSSLVERGRDGVPASPSGLLPSRLSGTQPAAATPRAGQQRRKTPMARQGGLQRDATGQLQIRDWPASVTSSQVQEVECAAR